MPNSEPVNLNKTPNVRMAVARSALTTARIASVLPGHALELGNHVRHVGGGPGQDPTSIDRDNGSRDERSEIRAQKQGSPRDIRRDAHAAEGHALRTGPLRLRGR